MGRIESVFAKKGKTAFIGFTVAGDPDKETSVRIAKALIDGGTDILELGVPFSDPVADGPTIQRADDRALAAGTTPDTIFAIVRDVRAYSDVPIVFLIVLQHDLPARYRAVLPRSTRCRCGRHSCRRHAGRGIRRGRGDRARSMGSTRSSLSPRPLPMSGWKQSCAGPAGTSTSSRCSG